MEKEERPTEKGKVLKVIEGKQTPDHMGFGTVFTRYKVMLDKHLGWNHHSSANGGPFTHA